MSSTTTTPPFIFPPMPQSRRRLIFGFTIPEKRLMELGYEEMGWEDPTLSLISALALVMHKAGIKWYEYELDTVKTATSPNDKKGQVTPFVLFATNDPYERFGNYPPWANLEEIMKVKELLQKKVDPAWWKAD